RRGPRPRADHPLLVGLVHRGDALHEPRLDERSLLEASTHLSLPGMLPALAPADDQPLAGLLLVPRPVAVRGLAPRRDRVAAGVRLALAAAVRVVHGVHRRAAHGRADATPAGAPGLAAGEVLVGHVAHLADRRPALDVDHPHLTRRQAQRRVVALLRHQLGARPGRAAHLPAAPDLQLDVVDHRAGRDVAQRERVPRPDVRPGPAHDGVADTQAERREDVALLAVGVVEQGDPGRAVRVVRDRGDLGRHAVLLALEVDDAVAALVAPAHEAGRDAAVVVPPPALGELGGERALRLRLRDLLEVRGRHEAAARRG